MLQKKQHSKSKRNVKSTPLYLCFLLLSLNRWYAAAATNAVWCCGHGSHGSLLERPYAQRIQVKMNTNVPSVHATNFLHSWWFLSILTYIFPLYVYVRLFVSPSCSLSMDEGIETAFLGTRSGLIRFLRYAGIEKRIGKWVRKVQLHLCCHTIISKTK